LTAMAISETEEREFNPLLYFLTAAIIIGIGMWLRWGGMFNDLSLDEIWLLNSVGGETNVSGLLAGMRYDNVASLHTLMISTFENRDVIEILRFPSFAAGSFSLLFIFLHLTGANRVEAIFALLFFSLSFLMVLYGSEASGYGAMVVFAVLSFFALKNYLELGSWMWLAAFWVFSCLAYLLQPSYAMFYLALLVWSASTLIVPNRSFFRSLLLIHCMPALVISGGYYFLFHDFALGDGSLVSYPDVIISSLSIALGGQGSIFDAGGEIRSAVALLVATAWFLIIIELLMKWKEEDSTWVFYFTAIFVCPVLFLFVFKPDFIAPAYFLSSVIALYLLLAGLLSRFYRFGASGKVFSIGLVAVFLYGNTGYLLDFRESGRGQYLKALRYIASQDTQDKVLITGDHDINNSIVISHYAPLLMPKEIRYVKGFEKDDNLVNWFLVQSNDREIEPVATFRNEAGSLFLLEKAFPHTALSGWTWFVYRRIENE